MTFSIVAKAGQQWGVAVASKFLAVGAAVPAAQWGVGAIATQAFANLAYRPDGLALLSAGSSAQEVLDALTRQDEGRAQRQAGVVDREGRAATFTGEDCNAWAGGRTGEGYAVQGNILSGPEVVDAIATAFETAEGTLAQRLSTALLAGDRAGGDRRGRQSAVLLVVSEGGGYGGGSDVLVDLRVDDHPDPVLELQRLLDLHTLYFGKPEKTLPLEGELKAEVEQRLRSLGYQDIEDWAGVENYEERMVPGAIDVLVLEKLREQTS
ncbi:MAG: fimbrial assembly protein FimA [Frankiales bacterium]|nr:fimbrial assembly protein FimA [Frankiales bacterium]